MFGNSCQHIGLNLLSIMKGNNKIGPPVSGEDFMRTRLSFHGPTQAKQRGQDTGRL